MKGSVRTIGDDLELMDRLEPGCRGSFQHPVQNDEPLRLCRRDGDFCDQDTEADHCPRSGAAAQEGDGHKWPHADLAGLSADARCILDYLAGWADIAQDCPINSRRSAKSTYELALDCALLGIRMEEHKRHMARIEAELAELDARVAAYRGRP